MSKVFNIVVNDQEEFVIEFLTLHNKFKRTLWDCDILPLALIIMNSLDSKVTLDKELRKELRDRLLYTNQQFTNCITRLKKAEILLGGRVYNTIDLSVFHSNCKEIEDACAAKMFKCSVNLVKQTYGKSVLPYIQ